MCIRDRGSGWPWVGVSSACRGRRTGIRMLGVSILSGMTLGVTPRQQNMFGSTVAYCEGRVPADSIYAVLHRECFTLFPDEMFADLFTDVGRRCVPPMIVAVVMVLQRIEGASDREAVDRFAFDNRWNCLLYTSPSPRDRTRSRMPSSA